MPRALLLFAALGGALFALERAVLPARVDDAERSPIRISAARVAAIEDQLAQSLGRAPLAVERDAALEGEIVDEVLYREARVRGLDQTDSVVRRRLLRNMRFLSGDDGDPDALLREARSLGLDRSDPVVRRRLIQRMRLALSGLDAAPDAGPPDLDLATQTSLAGDSLAQTSLAGDPLAQTSLARGSQAETSLRQPARVRIAQIFFDPARGDAWARAEAVLGQLRQSDAGPQVADDRGDPLLAPAQISPETEVELAGRFGVAFARELRSAPTGVWSGPLESSYGLHLVFVIERDVGSPLAPGVAWVVLREAARSREADTRLRAGVRELRSRYEVFVEAPD